MMQRFISLVAAFVCLSASFTGQAPPGASREALERAYRSNNLGVAYLEQFNFDAAADAFREALTTDSRLTVARVNLAIALLYGGHPDTAATEARAAAEALPARPQPPYLLGLIARSDNQPDAAIAAFRKVLELDPSDAASKINLAQVLSQERQYADAVKLLRDAAATEPYNATAAYSLATALTRSGDTQAGQDAMRHFQTLRDSAYAVTYAQAYLQQGRYAEAIASTGAEPDLVDAATPRASFADATAEVLGSSTQPPGGAAAAGSIVLFDLDDDGRFDLVGEGAQGVRLFRNADGRLTDATAAAKLPSTAGSAAIAGDYDNDGRPDLLLLRSDGLTLMHQRADRTFEDVTAAGGLSGAAPAARTAAWVDVDHDGDLDIVVAAPARVFRNNGNGTFADITAAAGIPSNLDADQIVPTDYDNRRDIDLLFVSAKERPALFRNMRDGTFQNAADVAQLPKDQGYAAAAAGDVNKDGFIDFYFARPDGGGVLAVSDGQQHFTSRPAPNIQGRAAAAQFVDYDNDGLLDLLVATDRGAQLYRNLGDRWQDVTKAAKLDALGSAAIRSVALGDIDGDGDTDVVARLADGGLRVWRNDGGSAHPSVRVGLVSRVSNRSAAGAKIEIRAGSLRQMLETSSAVPAAGPADLTFGLGSRASADVVRVLWPSGILQSETAPAPTAAQATALMKIEELDRKPSSCPYLFTWNGERYEFVTDFMGGGEMGDWVGAGAFNTPDPDEYVRIRGDQLRPRGGRYELRVTNELEEAMFLDRVQLIAVDHPGDVEVYPNEGLKEPPRPSFALYTTRGAHPPLRATDEHGHDVLALIAERDRRWPDDFGLLPIRGYADPHVLSLDLGPRSDNAVLLLTGWTDYAFSTDNVAASHAEVAMQAPRIEVRDADGAWRTAIENIGFPVGRPQTVAVDLRGRWLGPSREVRIVTNMRIYWDQVLVDTSGGGHRVRLTRIDADTARLAWRGFSAEVSPDGREPFGADYSRVSAAAPWKALPGRYTREGDVRSLLIRRDDMFVIAGPGDEIALSFDATRVPALPDGWRRTYLLYADGFSKEMNIRSATPDSLGPLPFHRMTKYPYGSDEHYPRSPAYRAYLDRFNTRVVTRPVPSLDSAAAGVERDVRPRTGSR